MPSPLIVPVNEIPTQEVFGIEKIRQMIPQRYEMEQLTGILLFDPQRKIAIGYKDITPEEFWVRGHIPGRPLMPGVMMCESAAQLCSFYFRMCRPEAEGFLGFAGMENVRFRGTVVPGNRFIIVVKAERIDTRVKVFDAQGIVKDRMVFEARIQGIGL